MANLPYPIPTAAVVAGGSTHTKKPLPWTHPETFHLIQAYQEIWYSLKRGQLKAKQWEEIATTIASRCGYNYTDPSKTSIQCRHKIEKLRKRFRMEKERLAMGGGSGASTWPYFALMNGLERGPFPISALPMAAPLMRADHEDDDDDEDSDNEEREKFSKLRSIDYILQMPATVKKLSNGGRGVPGFLPAPVVKRQRVAMGEGVREMAAEIRAFTEMFVGIENMKMEMMRETERLRVEMENKRMAMILESELKIVETIAMAMNS